MYKSFHTLVYTGKVACIHIPNTRYVNIYMDEFTVMIYMQKYDIQIYMPSIMCGQLDIWKFAK